MKRIILLFGLLLLCLSGSSQNPGWTMPRRFVKHSSGTAQVNNLPVPTTLYGSAVPNTTNYMYDAYDGQNAEYASNMVLDRNGNIRFFIVDGFIFDGQGNFIEAMFNASNQLVTGYSEIGIVPDPADCDRYYIIAHFVQNYDRLPYVFLLDMGEINIYGESMGSCNHYGQLVNLPFTNSTSLSIRGITPNWAPSVQGLKNSLGAIAISDLRSDNSYFAFVTNKQGIFRYKVSSNGFQYDNSLIPFPYYGYNQAETRSEMELIKLANGNYRIAVTYGPEMLQVSGQNVHEVLYTAELDANGNLIATSPKSFYAWDYNPGGINQSARFKGLEFSKNGNRLYVTRRASPLNPNQFSYYDFISPTADLLPINTSYDVQFSQIELDENDNLFFAHQNGLLRMTNASSNTPGPVLSYSAFPYYANYAGFPAASSTSLKLFALPDQIDGMDYEAYQIANLTCCINSATFDADTYVASSGTWSPNTGGAPQHPFYSSIGGDVYIKEELRIPAGVAVTINNMNFHFAPDARVVIENAGSGQGGKLTLNNTTFTVDDRCTNDKLWLGVEVWGNTTLTQGNISNTTQGRLLVQNNSKIEHASIGILVGKRTATYVSQGSCPAIQTVNPFVFDNTRNGGIVQMTNSSLHNNQRGVFFQPYLASNGSNNLSRFTLSNFVWNGPLKGNLSLQAQAQIYGVKGIQFVGCSFQNQTPSLFNASGRGTGILSLYGQFHVKSYCSVLMPYCTPCANPTNSSFEGLRFGVRTVNPDNLTFSVDRAHFSNCQYGIRAQSTKNSRITLNTFDIPQETYQTAGIAMYATPTFTIQENIFKGIGVPGAAKSYGIVVSNSGTANNDVYKNQFKDLYIAGQSEYNNAVLIDATNYPGSTGFNMSGLNWTCNEFQSGIVKADLTVVNGRIDLFQGFCIGHPSMAAAVKAAARNKFSLDGEGMTLEHDLLINGSIAQAVYYVSLDGANYFADSYSSNWVSNCISSYNGTPAEPSPGMCPSLICSKTHVQKLAERSALMTELDDLNQELQDLRRGDIAGIQRLQGLIHLKSEEIDHLETEMITEILLEAEDLANMVDMLRDFDQLDWIASLNATYSRDMTRGLPAVDLSTVEDFLPIVSGAAPRKTTNPAPITQLDFTVSPNPSNGKISIDFSNQELTAVKLSVVDLMGKTVFETTFEQVSNADLDLSALENGIYFLVVKSKDATMGTRKLEILR